MSTECKNYFKLSPQLTDGQHKVVVETIGEVIEAVKMWCEENHAWPGERVSIEVVNMAADNFDRLKEI